MTIDKILIQLPESRKEVIELLPFFASINKLYPNAEKNIFMIDDYSDILGVLPFKMKFYQIPEEVFSSPLLIHKYCANLHPVFNIDLSIALNLNWKSSLLGFAFRSRNRLGVKSFRASPFLTHSLKMYQGETLANFADRLVSMFTKTTVHSASISLPDYEIDDENFGQLQILTFVISEDLALSKGFQDCFKEFSECYDGCKFKIYITDHEEGREVLLKNSANKKNYYEIITDALPLEAYLKKTSYSNFLITDNMFLTLIAPFLKVSVFSPFKSDHLNHEGFLHNLELEQDGSFNVESLELEIRNLQLLN